MQGDQLLAGRYRLGERLGRGGMSVVWRAHDEVLERDVAVKVLVATDASARRRIRAEAKAAARMSHPNVTNVYDYGESTLGGFEVPFVVMEMLSGRTLASRLAAGALPPGEALRICAEVAAGLAAAHAQGLVHRDVKPENVMLTPTGAKLVDFGIAAVAGTPEIDFEGRLLGTPAYLAPERLDAGEVLPASDVYALGLLVHRVLAGRLPWRRDTQTGVLRAHAYDEPGPLPKVDGVPPEVGRLYLWCLAKKPADRPSAGEAARILTAALARMPEAPDGTAVPAPVADHGDPWVIPVPDAAGPPREPALRPSRDTVVGPAGPGRRSRIGSRVLVAVGAAVLGVVALAGTLGEPSARRPGAADLPRTGFGTGTGGPTSVALPVPVDAPRPPSPAGDAPAGSAAGPTTPTPTTPTPAAPASPDVSASAGPSTSAGPIRSPGPGGPAPTPTDGTSPTPGPDGVDVRARGGVVTVRCDGRPVEVLDVTPAAGYHVEAYDAGPARQVRVELSGADNRSVVTVRCANGRPVAQVKETDR